MLLLLIKSHFERRERTSPCGPDGYYVNERGSQSSERKWTV